MTVKILDKESVESVPHRNIFESGIKYIASEVRSDTSIDDLLSNGLGSEGVSAILIETLGFLPDRELLVEARKKGVPVILLEKEWTNYADWIRANNNSGYGFKDWELRDMSFEQNLWIRYTTGSFGDRMRDATYTTEQVKDIKKQYREQVTELQQEGLVTAAVPQRTAYSLWTGLEKIIQREKTYDRVVQEARLMFDRPDFYNKPEFIELVIKPELKQLADSLPHNAGRIIIDCGHIDNVLSCPTPIDNITFEDGVILLRYLQMKGHKDARLSVLYNEMHELVHFGIKEGRKRIKAMKKEAEKDGLNRCLEKSYGSILEAYGIPKSQWKNIMTTTFEGSLAFQARQHFATYSDNEESIVPTTEGGYAYVNKDGLQIPVLTETRAPICRALKSMHEKNLTDAGAKTVIYLYDERWGCGVRGGVTTATYIHGIKGERYAVFYIQNNDGIVLLPVQSFNSAQ